MFSACHASFSPSYTNTSSWNIGRRNKTNYLFYHWCYLRQCWFHSCDSTSDHVMMRSVKSEALHPVCLQVCWVWHSLTRCTPRYVTEKSTTDAKSIALIRFPLNFKLLRNLQILCCKLWPSVPRFPRNVYHHVITFPESREYWKQPCVKQPKKMGINRN